MRSNEIESEISSSRNGISSNRIKFYIEPPGVIVVLEKNGHISWPQEIQDITQILVTIAIDAEVAMALF